MPEVQVPVEEDEAEPAARPECQHAAEEDAAISTKDQRKMSVLEHRTYLRGEIHRKLPDGSTV